MKEEIQPKICFVFHYRQIATKRTSAVGHGALVLDMEFQENYLNGRRDTAMQYFVLHVDISIPKLQVFLAMGFEC